MKYSSEQLKTLRTAFQERFYQLDFPAGENSSIYEKIEIELDNFIEAQTEACRDKGLCRCIGEKVCSMYFPEKKSEQLFASRKQLSQLLYAKSGKDSFFPGFIRLCCLFSGMDELHPVAKSDSETNSLPKVAGKEGKITANPKTDSNSRLAGKWKYTCTSFDKSYQHGGIFIIKPLPNGKLKLQGQRMWKGLRSDEGKKWDRIYYEETEYTQWRSVYIYEIDSENFAFEYEVPQNTGVLTGYCRCSLIDSNEINEKFNGDFFELNSLINGQIVFEKIEPN
jgi:hypothetical protein